MSEDNRNRTFTGQRKQNKKADMNIEGRDRRNSRGTDGTTRGANGTTGGANRTTREASRTTREANRTTGGANRTAREANKTTREANKTIREDGKTTRVSAQINERKPTSASDRRLNTEYQLNKRPEAELREKNPGTDSGKYSGKYSGKTLSNKKPSDFKPPLNHKKFKKNEAPSSRENPASRQKQAYQKKSSIKGGCPYLRDCGGCNILKQSYESELKEKQKQIESLIGSYCKVEPILGMKQPNYYRNKVHVVFDHDKKGNPISGVYEEGTHRVVPVESCLIHNRKADAIIATIRGMLKSFKIKTYDEDTGYGLLRHVMIRTGFASGEIMVVLVLASPILPSKNNFVKALLKEHPEITTIVINVNDRSTSMVLGDKEQVIYGKGFIEDSLCGKVFRISPKSFYQVNPAQTEVLYGKAIEMAGLKGTETAVDAYCGTGTIGIIASDHVKKVIGVELNKDAVRDAITNAKRNEAKNIEFYNNDAGEFMTQMAEQKEPVDIVFLDPPRTGSSEKSLDALVSLKPGKVVYISCNPVTLERDLKYMTKKGYKAIKAVPVDMFPWTGHVESIVLLHRKNS